MAIFIACSLCLLSASACLSQPIGRPPELGTPAWYFERVPAERPSDLISTVGQLYTQTLPAVGREDLWTHISSRPARAGDCEPLSNPAARISEFVADLARTTRVVIVNEAHDIPWHRSFTRSLLAPLWDQGYRYFAAETFLELVNTRADEPFGRIDSGVYASEPEFGELIRSAKQLGYELVAYEATEPPGMSDEAISDRIEYREEAQANNLIDRVLARDPDARVLVHVGYSHAAEVPIPSIDGRMAWMAARLKEKTGIDPLTIDQTYCHASGNEPQLANPTNRLPAGTFDIAIAYPAVTLQEGRARWRLADGKRLVRLPDGLVPDDRRIIVEARRMNEPPEAIPVDRLLLEPGESIPLVLPIGAVRLTVLEEGGREDVDFQFLVD